MVATLREREPDASIVGEVATSRSRNMRDQEFYRRNKETKDATVRAYRKANPERTRAQRRLRHEVAMGRIVRPLFCEQCHGPGPVDGHHDDYTRPLEVELLCRSCPTFEHSGNRTTCRNGHVLTDENVRWSGGRRYCRSCVRENSRKRYWERKGEECE